MENLQDVLPADLLEILQDAAPALDCRSRERLAAGIEALLDENRDLAARAARAELERDALLAAVGRQGFVYDADGGVITAGPGEEDRIARALLGRQDVSLRYPGGEPVPPGDLPGYRALRGERLSSCRYTVHDPGGEDLHVVVSASPVVTDGAVSGAAVTWQDVTGEERTRRRLAEANTLLEGLFENLGDIVGIQLPDRTILRYNRAGYEMLGMTPEEVEGWKCYNLIGRAAPCSVCATELAVASKKREVVEKFVPELGRYLECRSSPILDEKGEVAFIVEQLYDVTDRRRAEDELRESEATARALLNAPSEIIALLDRDGRLIEINETTTRRFARSREDLIGRNIFQLFPPDEAAAYAARLKEVVASGRPARFEDAWGGRLYDVVLYPAADERGDVIRVAAIARDVTGKKRGEDALRKRTHDLNERVKELSILYEISRIIERRSETSLDEVFHEIIRVLSTGWQYPEDTVARITVHGRRFATERFTETPWRQASPIVVLGETVGMVEICYLHERPERDEGPFLAEERALLDTVARRLGSMMERFQAWDSLEKSESQFREIMQQSFDMIYTCYHEGGIAYISPAVTRILGYAPDEIVGRRCRDFVVPSSLPAWEEGRAKISCGEPVEGLEIEFRRKDGSVTHLELNESPIIRDLSVIGVHVVGRDITDRKQNERLRQRAFEQIERNIEQFAILGDHIRQPLQVILGMTELIDDGGATGRIREQVDRINGYITALDRGWIESRQVREFLRRHELA
ncbi:sensory histidine kinase AtoS [Methanoculleus chikugoensis]|uniref:Sensory histidine kinase AtoS n=1 Tax=Methanoculleus chikugoensis TaxID=118126 RepID=A0A1M4MPB1_9EURY|nr:PAS domain S-box protein [Methanoculleus chikugoensis]SCL76682.1 sensory histidine kinase AtoS [Methanoculleus chikugoensis]